MPARARTCAGGSERSLSAFNLHGEVIRAADLRVTGALMVLCNEAIMPNLVQTTENTPALVHAGPFANIAHGTASVISQKMALRLADYVVNETGFGADLGAEKYFDIVMPPSGLRPSVTVLIATAKALRMQSYGADPLGAGVPPDFSNLAKHIENLKKFGVPVVVAINRFPSDGEQEMEWISRFCREAGVASAVVDVFGRGTLAALNLPRR